METKSKIIKKENINEDLDLSTRLNLEDSSHSLAHPLPSDKKVLSKTDLKNIAVSKGIIEKAKQEAQKIKEGAKNLYLQVEQKTKESRQQGFEQGKQKGFAEVTKELTIIKKQNHEMLLQIEKEAISLVYEISQKIIGDALNNSDEVIVKMIRQALQSSMGNELILFVHPTDLEKIKEHETKLMSSIQTMQTLVIKASENVKEGGCVVESELGSIDAQLDLQMEAIKNALEL